MSDLIEFNPFSLSKRIKRPLILDGAMGSLLQHLGVPTNKKTWITFANIDFPEKVLQIHKNYITAGADIITTNTFRTNPIALSDFSNKKQSQLIKSAVELAKEAKNGLAVFIAGSNAPAEDCYQKDRKISYKLLEINHHKHLNLLIENGVDFILNETQSHFDEIKVICEYSAKNLIPFVLSIYLDETMHLLSGESFTEVLKFIWEHDPLAIGFNCISPTQFYGFKKDFMNNWGFYLNCGSGNTEDTIIKCGFSPGEYLKVVKDSIKYSPSFIGACCGSDPRHIRKIKIFFDGKN